MRNRYLTLFLVFCVAPFLASGCGDTEIQDIETEALDIAEIQDINEQIKELEKMIQRAADVEAIKDLMSYGQYHWPEAMGSNAIMSSVTKTPGQCMGQNDGYMYGSFTKRQNIDRGQGQGAPQGGRISLDFHVLTTSVIEIAEDGQTAKAVWYSPGVLGEPRGPGGEYMASWIYELYACDFVKEDGVWKSWHRTMSTDFSTSPDKDWIDTKYTKAGQDEIERIGGILERSQTGELKDIEADEGEKLSEVATRSFKDLKMVAYQSWTRETMPQYKPKPPVSYKTFSETFSYCPPMPKELEEKLLSEDLMF